MKRHMLRFFGCKASDLLGTQTIEKSNNISYFVILADNRLSLHKGSSFFAKKVVRFNVSSGKTKTKLFQNTFSETLILVLVHLFCLGKWLLDIRQSENLNPFKVCTKLCTVSLWQTPWLSFAWNFLREAIYSQFMHSFVLNSSNSFREHRGKKFPSLLK